MAEAARCFSCGTCNACDNCYLVCPEPCIVRLDRSNGLYKILVDYCKGCRVCIEECPTGCLEGVPELDFDTGVVPFFIWLKCPDQSVAVQQDSTRADSQPRGRILHVGSDHILGRRPGKVCQTGLGRGGEEW